jgi:hypothetical protein
MRVSELIEELKKINPDLKLKVVFPDYKANSYGENPQVYMAYIDVEKVEIGQDYDRKCVILI